MKVLDFKKSVFWGKCPALFRCDGKGRYDTDLECSCKYCTGQYRNTDWVIFGEGAYLVRESIKRNEHGATWDPAHKVWIVPGPDSEGFAAFLAGLVREAEEKQAARVLLNKPSRNGAQRRQVVAARGAGENSRKRGRSAKSAAGCTEPARQRPKGYCADLSCTLADNCTDPSHYTTRD